MTNSNVVEIDNTVKGRPRYADDYPEKADYWAIVDDGDGNYTLTYVMAEPGIPNYHFVHDIEIRVDYRAKLIVDMEITTGDLQIVLEQTNREIEIEKLTITTGILNVDFTDNTAVTGSLDISGTTGSIGMGFGTGTILDVDFFDVDITTGMLTLDMENVVFTSNLDIDLEITTGDFSLNWFQDSLLTNHTFSITGTTGDIVVDLSLNNNIGTIFSTSVTTGSSNVPSNTISQAGMGQLTFNIVVTTGSITAIRN
jgi:hypothetical protein